MSVCGIKWVDPSIDIPVGWSFDRLETVVINDLKMYAQYYCCVPSIHMILHEVVNFVAFDVEPVGRNVLHKGYSRHGIYYKLSGGKGRYEQDLLFTIYLNDTPRTRIDVFVERLVN